MLPALTQWSEGLRGVKENGPKTCVYWHKRTDTDREGKEAQASDGILEKIWPAGSQQGCAGPVILAVVRGVEAERRDALAREHEVGARGVYTFRQTWRRE